MSDNVSLLRKADITIAEFTSNGGDLLPEQGNTFIRKLLKTPTIIRMCRVVEMAAPQRNINKIGFASRILRPGVSGTALSQSDRASPGTEQITLNTKEVIAEVWIPYDVMEDQIERATTANNEAANDGPGGLRTTLIEMIAERVAVDLEEMAISGDKTLNDGTVLDLVDGYIVRANAGGNIVDHGGATLSKEMFKNGVKTMPDQYLRNRAAMKHLISMDQETEYRDTLANRGTQLGDSMVQGNNSVFAFGTPVEAVHLMPNAKGLFTMPQNLLMGIQRRVSMEFDKDISARVYKIVVTARVDFQIEEDEAVVLYTNIGG